MYSRPGTNKDLCIQQIELLEKLCINLKKDFADQKFQKIYLSNARLKTLWEFPGMSEIMTGIGWKLSNEKTTVEWARSDINEGKVLVLLDTLKSFKATPPKIVL